MKNKLVLKDDSTLEEAIRLLDLNGNGFLPVVDPNDRLIGILTDGDIRRAFLNKKDKLAEIINRKPVTHSHDISKKKAIQLLKSIHRRHLPLVDENNKLVDIVTLDDIDFNIKSNKVLIMAGGLGSRLGNLTHSMPKPMLPVGGKPILEVLMNSFIEHGFNEFYLSVNYKSGVIKDYFGTGEQVGAKITYLEETTRLGTAGALSLIEESINEPMIVINGDILTSLSFEELLNFHLVNDSYATMCVKEVEHEFPYGVVELDKARITSLKEKPVQKFFVNSGIYVLNPGALEYVPRNQFFNMTDLFDLLISKKKNVLSYVVNDYWMDIGQLKDYEAAQAKFNSL